MSVHLRMEIERLKRRMLELSALVEDQVERAVRALLDRDAEMAKAVIDRDEEIDHREVEVEEECLKTLALHQPVAIDLRLVVAMLKINSDLERIGDLAVNISRKAIGFSQEPSFPTPFDIEGMWRGTHSMLRNSIDALVNMDDALAARVTAQDDEVDRCKRQIRLGVEDMIREDPTRTRSLLRLLAAARNLERIADCACNIAEDVIYLVRGTIVRHRREE